MSRVVQSILTVVASALVAALVAWGVANAAAPAGVEGTVGPAGASGQDGADGQDGRDGQDGVDGQNGVDGRNGPTGPVGPPGPRGPQGAQGEPGPAGPAGADGAEGPVGPAGPAGAPPESLVFEQEFSIPSNTYPIEMATMPDVPAGRYTVSFGIDSIAVFEYDPVTSPPEGAYRCDLAVDDGFVSGSFRVTMFTDEFGNRSTVGGPTDPPSGSGVGYLDTSSVQDLRIVCQTEWETGNNFHLYEGIWVVLTPLATAP